MKKWVSRLVAFVFALACLITVTAPTYALFVDTPSIDPVEPAYVGILSTRCSISISSTGTAKVTSSVQVDSGYTMSVTLKLQRSRDNSAWSTLGTWTGSTAQISKTKTVTSGYYYRSQVTVKVYNSSGTLVETVTKSSSSIYY